MDFNHLIMDLSWPEFSLLTFSISNPSLHPIDQFSKIMCLVNCPNIMSTYQLEFYLLFSIPQCLLFSSLYFSSPATLLILPLDTL